MTLLGDLSSQERVWTRLALQPLCTGLGELSVCISPASVLGDIVAVTCNHQPWERLFRGSWQMRHNRGLSVSHHRGYFIFIVLLALNHPSQVVGRETDRERGREGERGEREREGEREGEGEGTFRLNSSLAPFLCYDLERGFFQKCAPSLK